MKEQNMNIDKATFDAEFDRLKGLLAAITVLTAELSQREKEAMLEENGPGPKSYALAAAIGGLNEQGQWINLQIGEALNNLAPPVSDGGDI